MLKLSTGPSPLSYQHGWKVKRLAILDPSAPPPTDRDVYFAPTVRTSKYSAKGKLLEKPRVIELVPGAEHGAVAWLDFHEYPGGVYIDYVRVRNDQRRKGHAARLVVELTREFGHSVLYDFGQVMSAYMGRIVRAMEKSGYSVRAHHDYD